MGGKAPGESPSAKAAGRYAREVEWQSAPARRLFFQQMAEAMRTGGVGARVPIIQRAVSDIQRATALAQQRAAGSFATADQDPGMAFARQQVLGQIGREGARLRTTVPTAIAGVYRGQAPTALGRAGAAQADLYGTATAGYRAALEAAAIKQQAISQAISTVAEATGRGVATWLGERKLKNETAKTPKEPEIIKT